ncbi:MAG: fibronectin type III domain-containing protein [Phycisphaerae bacterium]|nr:fibronectin type III domain-containing protein [Phycisphaerae bacterium]
MLKKAIFFSCFALLLGMAGNAIANEYIGPEDPNSGDNFWMIESNWLDGLPNINNTDGSQWAGMPHPDTLCIVQEGDDASAKGINIGSEGVENWMEIRGGTVTCTFFDVGRGGNGHQYDDDTFGHLLMTGGHLMTEIFSVPTQWEAPPVVRGEAIITGGVIDVSNLMQIGLNAGIGLVDFQGGVINCNNFWMNNSWAETTSEEATLDMAGGVLVCNGNIVDKLKGYIDQDWIVFYGQPATDVRYYTLDFGITNEGKTTLAAVDPATIIFENPWGPTPGNGDIVDITDGNTIISWNSGDPVGSYKHDVFFGTSQTPDLESQNQSETYYSALASQLDTTYYWRIAEVDESSGETYEGPIWQFTTADFLTVDDFDPNDHATYWSDTGSAESVLVENMGLSMQITCPAGQSGSAYRIPPQSNWDQQDLKVLRLSLFGNEDNALNATLSLKINGVIINYDNADGQLQEAQWTQWYISYSELAELGIDLNNVTKVEILVSAGAEDFQLDVDGIELTLLACVEMPEADINGDCVVNLLDMAALSAGWMDSGHDLP